MREIKFRLYSKLAKKYIDYITIGFSKTGELRNYSTEIGMGPVLEDNYIVEQYTGLKDKHGKEIYEGDIVEQFVCGVIKFKGKEAGRKTVWQVRWNEEECCFELHYVSGSLFGDSLMSVDDDYEVIGNIQQNPGLLEGKK